MKIVKRTRTVAQACSQSVQVKLALASGTVVGMILAAAAGSQWN